LPGVSQIDGDSDVGLSLIHWRGTSAKVLLDGVVDSADNCGMEISGHVQNGVVVLDESVVLPEGAAVRVILRTNPVIHVSPVRKRVDLPLVKSEQPGTLDLTNDQIAELLEAEDVEALNGQWNVPS